ncbi:MAG TPA: sigma 54-interacting transcriptional regulator [Anaerovoracaceae bacterium]|nr:sigma 54-interacting transcriptional regulator [Anaerovoracaceae bacterium]
MVQFDHEYMEKLNAAWERFIEYKDYDYSFMRPEILESWKRSRDFKVDPYRRKTAILPADENHAKLEANKMMMETVRPYMELLYSIVEGSGFYLMLCDKDGYILDLVGDRDIIEQGKENSLLVVGANRSESFAGTNAIGTCLTLKKPIQVWNGEHYVSSHKKYTCSGAPIFNQADQLIGCLNLTGEFTKVHTHTLGMVISAVDGICKELKIRSAYEEIEALSGQRNIILESVSSGLILLNGENRISQINGSALRMLQLENKSVLGKNFFDLVSIDEPSHGHFSFSNFDGDIYNREVNIYFSGSKLPPAKFNMSVNFIGHGNSKKDILIRLEEPRHINKLVNKIGGFKASYTYDNIIGTSPVTQKLIKTCERAAKSSSNVLILGESGTGKELVAQAIHNGSGYSQGPFIAINCGAIPKGLIESELFGYERGAFTGANREGNPGKFELADGGTIFLDEIGDMPLDVQVSLLRVLQTKEIIRIGAKYPKKINVRIIAATNRDLSEAIETRTFREDLFYRLNVLTIHVPPLRERPDDITELADYFAQTLTQQKNRRVRISAEVYDALKEYSWPGNIRELENAIERAINVTDDDEIRLEHLPRNICQNQQQHAPALQQESGPVPQNDPWPVSRQNPQDSYQMILSSLETTNGNVKAAAELLGISRRTLYRKLDQYKIDYTNYRAYNHLK